MTLLALGRRPEPLAPPAEQSRGMIDRLARFGTAIEFYAPGLKRWQTGEWTPAKPHRFVPVSVTGTGCALSCEHCKTKVLDGMIALGAHSLFEVARGLAADGTEGLLVSGGSTRTGGVPLEPHFVDLRRIKDELGLRVIVHSGVVSPRLAAGLATAGVDGVMLDVIGADDTIRDIYHLDLTTADFECSIARLAESRLRIIPHIVLGLHAGVLRGEANALEMIRRYPVSTLILVVLTPLVGTPLEHVPPPPIARRDRRGGVLAPRVRGRAPADRRRCDRHDARATRRGGDRARVRDRGAARGARALRAGRDRRTGGAGDRGPVPAQE